jgi:hypothetical protein
MKANNPTQVVYRFEKKIWREIRVLIEKIKGLIDMIEE